MVFEMRVFRNHNLIRVIHLSRNFSNFTYCKPLFYCNSPNILSKKHQRQFSFQESVESLVKTQTGIFKSLSESTIVEYSQKILLSIHENTGLPWWATIISTTILLRTTITLPVAIYQYHILAKLEKIKLEMPEIAKEMQKEMAVAIKMYKWDERTARITYKRSLRKQWTNLIERENCHPLKTTILIFLQIPLWLSISIALRNLVYMLPVPSIEAQLTFTELSLGGFGFIPNLTIIDSSYIFPVLLGIINYGIVEFQNLSRVDPPSKTATIITNLFKGLSLLMIPISASVPSCLVLYWTTSSAYGFVQNILLLSPKIRRFCRIPKTAKELEQPYEHISQQFIKKYDKLNIFS